MTTRQELRQAIKTERKETTSAWETVKELRAARDEAYAALLIAEKGTEKPAVREAFKEATKAWEDARAAWEQEKEDVTAARSRLTTFDEVKLLLPWLPGELALIYADAWADTGDKEKALATMRADPKYDTYFAGNRRKNGSLRMSEVEYLATTDAYADALRKAGVNPAVVMDQFGELIAGNVSADEFRSRVGAVYARVVLQEDEIRETYARYYNTELNTGAIVASVLDPRVDLALLNKQITAAEIGGEAALAGFDIKRRLANRLTAAGYSSETSAQLFGTAAAILPGLGAASIRQSEGFFGLQDFLRAEAFSDPAESRRIRRVLAGEASGFTEQAALAADEGGALLGLRQR
jgi:hypothetical protein